MVRATFLYAALTALIAYPLVLHPASSAMPGDPDTDLFIWTLAWNTHALTTDPLSIFDANIYHPHPRTLAFSENLIGSTVFAGPVLWLTHDPLLALNAVALLSIVLSGLGGYLLASRLGLSTPAAVLCGLVLAFSPARFFRIGQIHLTTIQWIPFCLAYLHAYLDEGERRDLRLAVAFFTMQALTSGHGAVYLAVAVTLLLIFRFSTGEPMDVRKRISDLGVAGVLLLAPALLIYVPYLHVQNEFGLERALSNWETSPMSFASSVTPLHQALFTWIAGPGYASDASAHLFPGLLALILAAAAWLWLPKSVARPAPRIPHPAPRIPHPAPRIPMSVRRHTLFYTLLGLLAVLLSAGPPLGLWPFVYALPGFSFIRVPSRFMLLGVLAIAVLAAIGFERMTRGLRPRRQNALAILAGAVIVAECFTIPLPAHRPYAVRIPAADRWLATQPRPFVVAELPADHFNERQHSTYMLHSMAHWQKTVHGHSGIRTSTHVDLYAALRRFPTEESLRALVEIGVTRVVIHADMYAPDEWTRVREQLPAFASWLKPLYEDPNGRVYALTAPQ